MAQKTQEELVNSIEDILERFDFEKVHAFMVINKWTWRGEKNPPDIGELRIVARQLLAQVAISDEPANNTGTGGFMAYKMPWGLSLHFSVESKSTY